MASNRIDFSSLSGRDYAMGVAFVFIGIAIAFGLLPMLADGLPRPLLAALGAVLGIVAWFSYLRKRND